MICIPTDRLLALPGLTRLNVFSKSKRILIQHCTSTMKRQRSERLYKFKSKGWLQTKPLNLSTAIEYFSMSEFYDKTSLQHKILTGELTQDQIKSLKGIIYRVEMPTEQPPSQPPHTFPLFIIHEEYQEQKTTSSSSSSSSNAPRMVTTPRAVYYISDGTIYKSPSLVNILKARVEKAKHHLIEAMKFLQNHAKFDLIRGGWTWEKELAGEIVDEGEGVAATGKDDSPVKSSKKKRRKVDSDD